MDFSSKNFFSFFYVRMKWWFFFLKPPFTQTNKNWRVTLSTIHDSHKYSYKATQAQVMGWLG
jgi:hypothetical protein